jgi:hypothetical protein
VRILENPGDSFEDAHSFPRCARKLSIFERRRARSGPPAGSHALSSTPNVPRRLRRADEFVQMERTFGRKPHFAFFCRTTKVSDLG